MAGQRAEAVELEVAVAEQLAAVEVDLAAVEADIGNRSCVLFLVDRQV